MHGHRSEKNCKRLEKATQRHRWLWKKHLYTFCRADKVCSVFMSKVSAAPVCQGRNMIQPPRQPSHKKSLRQKKTNKKRKYEEYYTTFNTPHIIQPSSTQHIKSQLVLEKDFQPLSMCAEKKAKGLTETCQVMSKQIISLTSHILAISVAKHPGREIISDTIKSQVS